MASANPGRPHSGANPLEGGATDSETALVLGLVLDGEWVEVMRYSGIEKPSNRLQPPKIMAHFFRLALRLALLRDTARRHREEICGHRLLCIRCWPQDAEPPQDGKPYLCLRHQKEWTEETNKPWPW